MTVSLAHRARWRTNATPRTGFVGGMGCLLASEIISGLLGFVVLVGLARKLGSDGFAQFEFASGIAAWLLVMVRSGVEQVIWREAARRPRLIGPLTNVLFTIKLGMAVVAYALILMIAATRLAAERETIAVLGLILFPAALCCDVAPRALGRFGPIALGQVARSIGLAGAVYALVTKSSEPGLAAGCVVFADAVGACVPTIWQARRYGWPRWRWRMRAGLVFVRRGLIVALTRWGRVGLYVADLLILGLWADRDLGPYSAARRLIFAAVAPGLVVPTIFGPILARQWVVGERAFGTSFREAYLLLLATACPIALGVALGAGSLTGLLFGNSYRRSADLLPVLAVRLPVLLLANLTAAALTASRRDLRAGVQVAIMAGVALIALPASIGLAGVREAGLAMVAVEALGMVVGWRLLGGKGFLPAIEAEEWAIGLGCMALGGVWIASEGTSLIPRALIAGACYVLVAALYLGSSRLIEGRRSWERH